MKFWIITPSLNQLAYLKRCVASVTDQITGGRDDYGRIEVHHHVQDGGSTDGSVEFLREYAARQPATTNYQLTFASEADEGMYDALNKGVAFALQKQVEGPGDEDLPGNRQLTTGNCDDEIVAWLNCDEQYLPSALQRVAWFFETHPDIDILCGDALVVDHGGSLLGFWKCMPLRKRYLEYGYMYNLSCAMFLRQRVFQCGISFNANFKAVGDQMFVKELLGAGVTSEVVRAYLAAYTFMPNNLSEQAVAKAELSELRSQALKRNYLLRFVFRVLQKSERLFRCCRMQKFPLKYSLYVDGAQPRQYFESKRVPASWPGVRNGYG